MIETFGYLKTSPKLLRLEISNSGSSEPIDTKRNSRGSESKGLLVWWMITPLPLISTPSTPNNYQPLIIKMKILLIKPKILLPVTYIITSAVY